MLRRLFAYAPLLLLAAGVTNVAFSLMPILQGLALQAIFSSLEVHAALSVVVWAFVGYAAALLGTRVLAMVWFWFHNTFEPRYEGLLRVNLLEWVLKSRGRVRNAPSGAVTVNHARDDVEEYVSIVNESYRIFGEAAFAATALVIMIRIDLIVTVATVIPIGLVVLATHIMRARLPALMQAARDSTTRSVDALQSFYQGATTLRAFGATSAAGKHFEKLSDIRGRAAVRAEGFEASIESVTAATVNASKGLVLLFAASRMLAGEFGVGDFVLFATYLEWMLDFPRRIGRLLSQSSTTLKARDRLAALVEPGDVSDLTEHRDLRPVELTSAPHPVPDPQPTACLDATGLRFAYQDQPDTHVLSGVDIRLSPGQLKVVTGAVGSGKSTMLRVLAGDLQRTGGDVTWSDTPTEPDHLLAPPLGAYLPQRVGVFSTTIQENIELGLTNYQRRAWAVTAAGLAPDLAAMPGAERTQVGSAGSRLSGGQLQRLGIARVILPEARCYLLDDPMASLDHETGGVVLAALNELRAVGAAILIATHDERVMQQANEVIILSHGEVKARGTWEDLRTELTATVDQPNLQDQ